jgi:Putative adipose-regulatory protein (Seipin)
MNAGTFMVKIDLRSSNSVGSTASRTPKILVSSSRSATLHYQSSVQHVLRVVFLFPLYLTGYLVERQKLKVDLVQSYQEDPFFPVTDTVIEIRKATVDVYQMTLLVEARLEGVKYYLEKYPIIIGSFLVTLNFLCGLLLVGFSVYHRFSRNQIKRKTHLATPTAPVEDYSADKEILLPEDFDPLETVDRDDQRDDLYR